MKTSCLRVIPTAINSPHHLHLAFGILEDVKVGLLAEVVELIGTRRGRTPL